MYYVKKNSCNEEPWTCTESGRSVSRMLWIFRTEITLKLKCDLRFAEIAARQKLSLRC